MKIRPIPFLSALVVSLISGCATTEQTAIQSKESLVDGSVRAVAYSGFRTGQHPDRGEGAKNPSREEVLEDLHILIEHELTLIRLYDSKENSQLVLELIRSEGLPITVMLGAWLDAEISNHATCAWLTEPIPEDELSENKAANIAEVALAIDLANEYSDIIVAVNIGNETLVDWNDHGVPIETLVAYLKQVGAAIDQPVTTAENYEAYITYAKDLEPVIDFAGVHTYPVWEGKTIDEAVPYSIENMLRVHEALPNTPLAIAEAGWADIAIEFPEQASTENQTRYFTELLDWCSDMNITLFWFEAFDEDWKGHLDNPDGAEKHWGLWDVNRKPKPVVQELL